MGRDLVGHVDVEEFQPPADGLWIGRIDVAAVDHVDEQRRRLGEGVDQRRPLGPVCSSWRAPDRKTGTLTVVAQPIMERRSKRDGSRPGPVPGATSCGPTRLSRPSAWWWRA